MYMYLKKKSVLSVGKMWNHFSKFEGEWRLGVAPKDFLRLGLLSVLGKSGAECF